MSRSLTKSATILNSYFRTLDFGCGEHYRCVGESAIATKGAVRLTRKLVFGDQDSKDFQIFRTAPEVSFKSRNSALGKGSSVKAVG